MALTKYEKQLLKFILHRAADSFYNSGNTDMDLKEAIPVLKDRKAFFKRIRAAGFDDEDDPLEKLNPWEVFYDDKIAQYLATLI